MAERLKKTSFPNVVMSPKSAEFTAETYHETEYVAASKYDKFLEEGRIFEYRKKSYFLKRPLLLNAIACFERNGLGTIGVLIAAGASSTIDMNFVYYEVDAGVPKKEVVVVKAIDVLVNAAFAGSMTIVVRTDETLVDMTINAPLTTTVEVPKFMFKRAVPFKGVFTNNTAGNITVAKFAILGYLAAEVK
ncbi:MAG: hypothetical protein M0R66_03910 [Candidatus Omnitrophica bacterium]|nr:hypothetical protein [Candidatus Omnitrophota bacterium]